ncbi:hypothetical protein F5Y17DRAFT_463567 [Xylariaceae sp. FL0594]|nr:hypothetical protein F5Y17DRAFT_463567 [Xylariaceae sp. FL0594]
MPRYSNTHKRESRYDFTDLRPAIGSHESFYPSGLYSLQKSSPLHFFENAPSYESTQTRNVAWSYGNGNAKYMKGEASYTGELANWVKNVRGPVNEKMKKEAPG